jgi:hypothetical protein
MDGNGDAEQIPPWAADAVKAMEEASRLCDLANSIVLNSPIQVSEPREHIERALYVLATNTLKTAKNIQVALDPPIYERGVWSTDDMHIHVSNWNDAKVRAKDPTQQTRTKAFEAKTRLARFG